MKRKLALLLATTTLLSTIAACGGTPQPSTPPSSSSNPPAASTIDTTKPEFWKDIDFTEDVHLTFAIASKPGSGSGVTSQKAIELIKERSNGKIVIEQVGNGALGNEASTFAQCMEGSIDITGIGTSIAGTYTDTMNVFQLPFLIQSYEQEAAVMQSDEWIALRERANEEMESVTIISMTEFGMREFATIDKPIRTIDDIKGLKLRSVGNPIIDEALSLVGANPVNIAYTDLYSSLQNGVVDGEEVNATSVSMQKHYEVVNYISEIGFYPYLSMAVMSNATIDALPEGYFELIAATFAETDAWYAAEQIYVWDSESRQDCIDNGVEFNTIEDPEVWLERMQPLYERVAAEDPMYAAFIKKAQELHD